MNETIENLKTRRSCRAYRNEQISKEQLETILEAGTFAPTGMGNQSPVIVVVQDKSLINRIARMNAAVMDMDTDPFYGAPTLLIVLADKAFRTWHEDGVLVMGNLLNAAHAVGVDSCYIYRAKEVFASAEGKALLESWGIHGDYEGIGNCILGYAAEGGIHAPKPRKKDYVIYAK